MTPEHLAMLDKHLRALRRLLLWLGVCMVGVAAALGAQILPLLVGVKCR